MSEIPGVIPPNLEGHLAVVAEKYGVAAAAHEASEILDGYYYIPPETHSTTLPEEPPAGYLEYNPPKP